jgi:hypothetical protein
MMLLRRKWKMQESAISIGFSWLGMRQVGGCCEQGKKSRVHKRRVMSWRTELLSSYSTTTCNWNEDDIVNERKISDRKWAMHWMSTNMVCGVQDVLTCTVLSYADVWTADTCYPICAVSGSSRPHILRKFQTPVKLSVRPFLRQISSNLWHEHSNCNHLY